MRSINAGLRTYLAARTYLTGIPVYGSGRIDQGAAMPAVSIHRMSTDPNDCMDAHDDSCISERFLVLPWAQSDEQALSLSEQIAQEIDDYTGAMGSDRIAKAVYVEDESGDFDPEEYGGESGRFVHPLALLIMHSPA